MPAYSLELAVKDTFVFISAPRTLARGQPMD